MTSLHSSNCVLLVEDDDLVSTTIGSAMRSRGYAVTSVRSGEELIAKCKSEPDGCVIIDIDLGPRNMTGLELLRWMRSNCWTIPVIILSGKITVSEAVEALKESVVDIISKPPSVPQLLSAVEVSLSGSNSVALQNSSRLRAQLQSIVPLERVVLSMLLSGASNKVIASRLDLGLRSAVRYRKSILDRFGFNTVAELANALGAAGINVTELASPQGLTPGIPQKHRTEIRNRLQQIVARLEIVDVDSSVQKHEAIHGALSLLRTLSSHPFLDTSKTEPSVLVVAEDQNLGLVQRDLLRSHGVFAELCKSVNELPFYCKNQVVRPMSKLILINPTSDAVDATAKLVEPIDEIARIIIVTSEPVLKEPSSPKFRFASQELLGQPLVDLVLSD